MISNTGLAIGVVIGVTTGVVLMVGAKVARPVVLGGLTALAIVAVMLA